MVYDYSLIKDVSDSWNSNITYEGTIESVGHLLMEYLLVF